LLDLWGYANNVDKPPGALALPPPPPPPPSLAPGPVSARTPLAAYWGLVANVAEALSVLLLREGRLGEKPRWHDCTRPHLYGEAVRGVPALKEGLLAAGSWCLFGD
jgi:hypothetical protein